MFVLEFVAAVAGSSSNHYTAHNTHTYLRRTHLLLPVHLSALRLKRASRRRRGQLAQLTINAAVTQVGRSRPLSLSLYVSLPDCLSVCVHVCVCVLSTSFSFGHFQRDKSASIAHCSYAALSLAHSLHRVPTQSNATPATTTSTATISTHLDKVE